MTEQEINTAIAKACGYSKYAGLDVPSYCTDLNEMALAEATLSDDQWDAYCGELGGSLRSCASAIAFQRAEAFVRIIGKWKD